MELAYREYGSGQSLIILHGLFGQSDNWNTLAKRFSDYNFNVFTIDQRNHGLSPHAEEWNYEVMAGDLNEFISKHKLVKPIILGHSMGGKTAMFFDLLYPSVAKKIIVVDIAPRAYEAKHDLVFKGLKAVNFETIKTRKEVELILNEYISDFGTKQFLLKNIYYKDEKNSQLSWRFNLRVIDKNYLSIGEKIPELTSNTTALFVGGEKSDYITINDRPEIKKHFPNSKIVSIPNAGHWIHAEKPNEFFELILNFIKD